MKKNITCWHATEWNQVFWIKCLIRWKDTKKNYSDFINTVYIFTIYLSNYPKNSRITKFINEEVPHKMINSLSNWKIA